MLSLMELDRETGEVVVTGRVDREEFSWLNFTVEAVDSGVPSRFSYIQVVVQVSVSCCTYLSFMILNGCFELLGIAAN